jgi:hypothetical protein
LAGAGVSVDDIGRDGLIGSKSGHAIRCVLSRFGISLRDRADSMVLELQPAAHRALAAAARARGITATALAATVLDLVVQDRLVEAVLDDQKVDQSDVAVAGDDSK